MDWGRLGHVDFTWNFFISFISIILIDLMLAGDNAVGQHDRRLVRRVTSR